MFASHLVAVSRLGLAQDAGRSRNLDVSMANSDTEAGLHLREEAWRSHGDRSGVLTRAALTGLRHIFKPGYRYKKAGIMLMALVERTARQASIFDNPELQQRSMRLMAAMDAVNRQFGRDTLKLASTGIERRWAMRSENRSPRYTTRWEELPEVR